MNSLVKRELVRGLPDMEFCNEGLCEACEKGKSNKASHRSKDSTSINVPLQLLHMDLFGPMNVLSFSRKRYAMVIVDDFSKYTCVRSGVFVEGGLNTNCTVLLKFVWIVLLFKYETNLRRKYKRNNI